MTDEEAALRLADNGDYQVLRRVPPIEAWDLPAAEGETVRAAVIDCEATGLGPDDEACELAIIPFDYCRATGRVTAVHVDQTLSGYRQPTKPIPAEATAIHGITDEMVRGSSISDHEVAEALGDAKIVIAHNAGYDRRMVVKHWPQLDTVCLGCTWNDIDWRKAGFDSGKLAYLLFRIGYFFDGHRALGDAMATLFLLRQMISGEAALFALLTKAREPLYKVTVRNSPYATKDAIKARGYRWDDHPARGKSWWTVTTEPDVERKAVAEIVGFAPAVNRLPLVARHSDRIVEM